MKDSILLYKCSHLIFSPALPVSRPLSRIYDALMTLQYLLSIYTLWLRVTSFSLGGGGVKQ